MALKSLVRSFLCRHLMYASVFGCLILFGQAGYAQNFVNIPNNKTELSGLDDSQSWQNCIAPCQGQAGTPASHSFLVPFADTTAPDGEAIQFAITAPSGAQETSFLWFLNFDNLSTAATNWVVDYFVKVSNPINDPQNHTHAIVEFDGNQNDVANFVFGTECNYGENDLSGSPTVWRFWDGSGWNEHYAIGTGLDGNAFSCPLTVAQRWYHVQMYFTLDLSSLKYSLQRLRVTDTSTNSIVQDVWGPFGQFAPDDPKNNHGKGLNVQLTGNNGESYSAEYDEITIDRWAGPSGNYHFVGDFDGDHQADFAVWRPSTGNWFVTRSSDGVVVTQQWGSPGDFPVPGDYDGDGKTDFAVWRPSDGNWHVIRSRDSVTVTQQWGSQGDIPVPGDYDGDGKTDFAVWRPFNQTWYVIRSSDSVTVTQQLGSAGDIPVPGDYDGDGKTDFATWRPSDGTWHVIRSSDGVQVTRQWGSTGDIPVPGDYDGDGKTDFAVWRQNPTTGGTWYVIRSSDSVTVTQQWGSIGDIPVPAKFDADLKTDFVTWRPSVGNWYVLRSSDGVQVTKQFGSFGDIP